jgi:hypothetical protein
MAHKIPTANGPKCVTAGMVTPSKKVNMVGIPHIDAFRVPCITDSDVYTEGVI